MAWGFFIYPFREKPFNSLPGSLVWARGFSLNFFWGEQKTDPPERGNLFGWGPGGTHPGRKFSPFSRVGLESVFPLFGHFPGPFFRPQKTPFFGCAKFPPWGRYFGARDFPRRFFVGPAPPQRGRKKTPGKKSLFHSCMSRGRIFRRRRVFGGTHLLVAALFAGPILERWAHTQGGHPPGVKEHPS